ncbi:unnamed protein product [Lupinus luteus]|uniref:RNase H type-1 domain-containing protein n=1 Tax=Lupinus luteus TaxID=3873 RepID=A0AAV1WG19_LUPLU
MRLYLPHILNYTSLRRFKSHKGNKSGLTRQLLGRLFLKHFLIHLRSGKIGKRKIAFLSIRRKKEGAARPGKRTKYALVSEKQPGNPVTRAILSFTNATRPNLRNLDLAVGNKSAICLTNLFVCSYSDPINREWMPGKPGERMGWSSYRYYRIGLYILYYSHATSGPFQARECRDWQVQIVHVLREGNRCADFLARMGSSQLEQFMPWESPSRLLVSPSRASVAKRLAAAPAKLRQQPLPSSIPSLTAPSLCAPFSSKPEGNDKIKNRSAPSLCAMQEVPWLIEVNQSAMFSLIALPIDRLQKASPGEQQDELCLTVDESLYSDAFKSLQLCDPASLGIPGVKPMTGIDEVIPRSGKEARLADLEFLNPISLVLYYYYNGALARLHPKLKPASPPSIPFSESAPLEICLSKASEPKPGREEGVWMAARQGYEVVRPKRVQILQRVREASYPKPFLPGLLLLIKQTGSRALSTLLAIIDSEMNEVASLQSRGLG